MLTRSERGIKIKKMKKFQAILFTLVTVVIAFVGFSGCGPTAEDILKQYDTYGEIKPDENKAGVSIQVGPVGNFTIKYSTLLNANAEHKILNISSLASLETTSQFSIQ